MAQSTRPPTPPPPPTPTPHRENHARESDAERQVREDQERQRRAAAEERQARDDAEKATAHLPRQGETPQEAMTPQQALDALEEQDTVLMNFPEAVTLTLPGYQLVYFPPGVNEVPASLADDTYLAASGATPLQRAIGRY
jgi:hypothetical protein